MALLFSEEFETAVGTAPVGWTNTIGNLPVVSTDGYHNHGCNIANATARKALGGLISTGSVFFALKGNGVFTGLQQVGTSTVYNPIFSCTVQADSSVAVYDGGGGLVCEGINSFDSRGNKAVNGDPTWTFVQVDLTITISGIVAVLRISGEEVTSGASTFANAGYFDQVQIAESLPVLALIDSIYCYDSIVTTPIVTPNQGTPNARVSQAVFEYLDLDVSVGRVSQGVIEYNNLPNSANARVSQGVIELVLAPSGGWQVYEA